LSAPSHKQQSTLRNAHRRPAVPARLMLRIGVYGHLAPSYVAEAIRAGAPRFGAGAASNIKPLRR
jgi:hypothetical protein